MFGECPCCFRQEKVRYLSNHSDAIQLIYMVLTGMAENCGSRYALCKAFINILLHVTNIRYTLRLEHFEDSNKLYLLINAGHFDIYLKASWIARLQRLPKDGESFMQFCGLVPYMCHLFF